ncbi:N/A [soil metagenome]
MVTIRILADDERRNERIYWALEAWDDDALLAATSINQVDMIRDDDWGCSDIVILDHGDPVELRLLAIEAIRHADYTAKIIVTGIPQVDENERKRLIFQYLEQGAAGYVAEDQLDVQLVAAIQSVQQDGAWIEPAMKVELIQRTVELHDALAMLRPHSVTSGQANALTRRQHEVLELLAAGHTNKEIADELHISVGTVKNHVHRILDVLRASSREQAAQYYQFLQEPSAVA